MNIETKKISDIIPYQRNAKKHSQVQIDNVAQSIKEFGIVQPIVVDKDNNIIIGHCRALACKKLGIEEVPVVKLEDLTPEEANKLRLLDNKLNESEWDFELLAEDIPDLDFDGFEIDWELPEVEEEAEQIQSQTLAERFIAPPISVFDSKQGYWKERKKQWLGLGIKSENGRKKNLSNTNETETLKYVKKTTDYMAPSTSIFDPVTAEICYKWFNVDNGKIIDPFAGGSVRGIVAEKLGYKYTGIDLRKEQVEENNEQAKKIGLSPTWICDDSLNIDKYAKDETFDLLFTCPPYADLEIYSDDPRDISNMNYDDFKETYFEIIKRSCKKVKQNRFAVIVVGEIRGKDEFYRGFVEDTKEAFYNAGFKLYNEIIYLENFGTIQMRAARHFNIKRKTSKCYQNVLVFYKGDVDEIKENYHEVEVMEIETDEKIEVI